MKHQDRFDKIYSPHFKLCDDILKHLYLDHSKPDVELTKKQFLAESDNQIDACYRTLESDGFILRGSLERELRITGEGIAFRALGGYEYKIKHEDHLSWLAEKQMETTIDVNKQLRWTNFLNVIFIAISTIFITGTFFNDLKCNKASLNRESPKAKNDTTIVIK